MQKEIQHSTYAPFTDSISVINNTPVNNGKNLHVVMSLYNLLEYRDNFAKTSGDLWQYHKDYPNDSITYSEPFSFKTKITERILLLVIPRMLTRNVLIPDKVKKLSYIFIFTRLCGASKGFIKAFIKPFEAPQTRVKIKI